MIQNNKQKYNTSINVIGGIKDWNATERAVQAYFSERGSVKNMMIDRNEFLLPTERSRERVERGIRDAFLSFYSSEHEQFIQSLFSEKNQQIEKELILFWQFALNNRLFREISLHVFVKMYLSGRANISKDDNIGYLKELCSTNNESDLNWSQSTINTLATKYLNLMTKLNFLEGAKNKSFPFLRISNESLVLFIYFLKIYKPELSNILKNDFLPLCFLEKQDFIERVKKLALKDYFHMNYNGEKLNIELTTPYEGIADVIYNRS